MLYKLAKLLFLPKYKQAIFKESFMIVLFYWIMKDQKIGAEGQNVFLYLYKCVVMPVFIIDGYA